MVTAWPASSNAKTRDIGGMSRVITEGRLIDVQAEGATETFPLSAGGVAT